MTDGQPRPGIGGAGRAASSARTQELGEDGVDDELLTEASGWQGGTLPVLQGEGEGLLLGLELGLELGGVDVCVGGGVDVECVGVGCDDVFGGVEWEPPEPEPPDPEPPEPEPEYELPEPAPSLEPLFEPLSDPPPEPAAGGVVAGGAVLVAGGAEVRTAEVAATGDAVWLAEAVAEGTAWVVSA